MVDPGGTAVATDPIAVLSTVINTTGASNYVANGAQTCLDSVVTTLTPSTTTDYTGTAPNTYPYNGDHTTFTNVSPFTAALTVRADRGTDIGYTVRGDDTSLVALFQGLYIFATANFNSTASNSFFQLLDAASFRIEQGLEGSAITAPTGTVTATAGGTFSGLRAVLSELGLKENRLKDIDASHENLLTLLTDQVAKLEDADPYESITKIQGLQAQLTSSFQVTAALRQLTLSNFI
jgi:flagellin-like hook-associated protein FlgL